MGIKGSVRRATDGHIIHTNVDTDVIVSEEPELGSTRKPEEMYHIIERFCNGRWEEAGAGVLGRWGAGCRLWVCGGWVVVEWCLGAGRVRRGFVRAGLCAFVLVWGCARGLLPNRSCAVPQPALTYHKFSYALVRLLPPPGGVSSCLVRTTTSAMAG